jgi:rhodanese-related sulfurtransferase
MKSKLFLGVVAALGLTLAVQQLQAADGVDVKQAQTMNKEGALLLDVREPEEFSAGHAPEAKLIPLGQLAARLQEIAEHKDKPVVVICRSGRRSGIAVAQLQAAGFTQVSNVQGGMQAWEKSGLEVVKQ